MPIPDHNLEYSVTYVFLCVCACVCVLGHVGPSGLEVSGKGQEPNLGAGEMGGAQLAPGIDVTFYEDLVRYKISGARLPPV